MTIAPERPALRPSILQSPLLSAAGVPHAFTTRHGGCSSGIFSTLNFGNPGDLAPDRRDPPANIQRNWHSLAAAIEREIPPAKALGHRQIVEVHQIHGAAVCMVRAGETSPRDAAGHDAKADVLVTDDPARFIAVRVADCAPVLLASHDGRIVSAVHAGWRGVVGAAATAAVRAMDELGAEPTRLVAAIGPCIGPQAFEVGEDVAIEFRRIFGAATTHVRPAPATGKSTIDLKAAIREQLLACGLAPSNIDALPHCTVRDHADFFSHRREQGLTGRMVGIIGPKAPGVGP